MPRSDWSCVPVVTIPVFRAVCPGCGSPAYLHVWGEANGDGSTTQRVKCGQCNERFKITREFHFPESGELDF
ncbi:MAG: hypothetical protein IAF94_20985 [Pirellulaceae bacterium]|nr:hypothetical protein [Pirellulaceae bacterium]